MWPWRSKQKDEERIELDQERIPEHIAIIMDGNGRWAKQRGLPRALGHKSGVDAVRSTVEECARLGVKVLTLYVFSTENWRRPKEEVSILMSLLTEYLKSELPEVHKHHVRIRMIGDPEGLPREPQEELKKAIQLTKDHTGMMLNLALNYGGRAELIQAVRRISADVQKGGLQIERIDESVVNSYLYTAGLPDPDLIIRTSGERRLSNFLLWQASYAEIIIVQECWPDFDVLSLHRVILAYQQRDRRFGGIKE
ncbi:MAG: isoprenyl transferase [Peptococcaceae bacterium]|jgi:undecaprenyl diphosphate synthase|nr:isoprenyl transferase [Peptococcaceae bacterium]